MEAVVVVQKPGAGSRCRLRLLAEAARPEAKQLSPTDVLVEVHACALSHLDAEILNGLGSATGGNASPEVAVYPVHFPFIPGHCVSGKILAAGSEAARRFSVDDNVVSVFPAVSGGGCAKFCIQSMFNTFPHPIARGGPSHGPAEVEHVLAAACLEPGLQALDAVNYHVARTEVGVSVSALPREASSSVLVMDAGNSTGCFAVQLLLERMHNGARSRMSHEESSKTPTTAIIATVSSDAERLFLERELEDCGYSTDAVSILSLHGTTRLVAEVLNCTGGLGVNTVIHLTNFSRPQRFETARGDGTEPGNGTVTESNITSLENQPDLDTASQLARKVLCCSLSELVSCVGAGGCIILGSPVPLETPNVRCASNC
eukprot:INCI673.2.p1 GENE.INCI673.2~~INCI673.2.p1  ORF type:complete len:373 (-),score=58.98 INCI673.2:66-1184(-)